MRLLRLVHYIRNVTLYYIYTWPSNTMHSLHSSLPWLLHLSFLSCNVPLCFGHVLYTVLLWVLLCGLLNRLLFHFFCPVFSIAPVFCLWKQFLAKWLVFWQIKQRLATAPFSGFPLFRREGGREICDGLTTRSRPRPTTASWSIWWFLTCLDFVTSRNAVGIIPANQCEVRRVTSRPVHQKRCEKKLILKFI